MAREKNDNETASQFDATEDVLALIDQHIDSGSTRTEQDKTIHPAEDKDARSENAPGASKPNGLWRILVFLLKLGLFLVFLGILAAGFILGWPIVYRQYILPVENNTAEMVIVKANQQESQAQLFALETQLPALATTQARQSAPFATLAPQLEALQSQVETHTQALADLQSTQTSMQTGDEHRQAELERELGLLKSLELLSRSRLFLYQSNFGLAKQDMQNARDLLAGILASPLYPVDKDLIEVVQRLDLALSRLPDFPVAASGDLDIAWQILMQGLPQASPTALSPASNETPTPALLPPALSDTPFPTPTITATP